MALVPVGTASSVGQYPALPGHSSRHQRMAKTRTPPGRRLRALRPSVASPTGRPLGSMGSGSLTHPGWQPLPLTTASLSASPLRADAVLLSVTESLSGELF